MEVLIITIFCLVGVLCIYILIRNDFVCNFEISLNTRCARICENHLRSLNEFTPEAMEEHQALVDVWQSIMDIPYEKFLFSFKPLKPEYWLTEKQLAFLRINKF